MCELSGAGIKGYSMKDKESATLWKQVNILFKKAKIKLSMEVSKDWAIYERKETNPTWPSAGWPVVLHDLLYLPYGCMKPKFRLSY